MRLLRKKLSVIIVLLKYDFISMITDRNTKLYKALQTYMNPTVYTM